MQREIKRVHLATFHIAGFAYYDGCDAIEHLKIGTSLELEREAENQFDPYAVAIYYDCYKLGFVPRDQSHDISKYLDMGWNDMFEVKVVRVTPDAHPEGQVELNLFIKRNCKGN